MSALKKCYIRKLRLKRYSLSTIQVYSCCFDHFINYFGEEVLPNLSASEIHDYLLQKIVPKYSKSTQNQYINAIKFYYEKVMGKQKMTFQIDRPFKDQYLPVVLDQKEVEKLLNTIKNLKHRSIITLLYAAGLRIGEALNLKLLNINSHRMVIEVQNPKGNKDRIVPLRPPLLKLLRQYFKIYRPKKYLFEGANSNRYSASSVRKVIKKACQAAGIRKKVTAHTFRHSYATHLLEMGIDLRYIQTLPGHNSVKTTEIYTHVSTKVIGNIKSPIENLNLHDI